MRTEANGIHPASDHQTYLRKWDLTKPELLADTPTSMVWKICQNGGEPAVLKLLKPLGLPQEMDGADYLQWRGGNGCAHLLKRDGSVFLIEYLGDYTLRDHILASDDKQATKIICDVVRQLQMPVAVPPPENLPDLRPYCEALYRKAESDRKSGKGSLIIKAAKLLDTLIEQQQDVRPLHGDLHHRNIMQSPTRGWLVIDPGSLIADPAFEVANVFFNPDDMELLVEDPNRMLYLAKVFAPLLNRPEKTILQYGFVYACLSASWSIEDDRDPASRLRAANILSGLL